MHHFQYRFYFRDTRGAAHVTQEHKCKGDSQSSHAARGETLERILHQVWVYTFMGRDAEIAFSAFNKIFTSRQEMSDNAEHDIQRKCIRK